MAFYGIDQHPNSSTNNIIVENTVLPQKTFRWTPALIKFLVKTRNSEYFDALFTKYNLAKDWKKVNSLWEEIVLEGELGVKGKQASLKYRDLFSVYKVKLVEAKKSATEGITWKYFELFQTSLRKGVEVEAPANVTVGGSQGVTMNNYPEELTSENKTKKIKHSDKSFEKESNKKKEDLLLGARIGLYDKLSKVLDSPQETTFRRDNNHEELSIVNEEVAGMKKDLGNIQDNLNMITELLKNNLSK